MVELPMAEAKTPERKPLALDAHTRDVVKRQRVTRLLFFTEVGEGSCPLACNYCEPAGTRLLASDGRWVPIETIETGDTLIGFGKEKGQRPRFKPAVVIGTATRKAPVYRITTDKGEVVATGDHKWYSDHDRWRRTDRFKPGQVIRWVSSPIDPPEQESVDYRLGYVVGAGLGDGTLGHYHYDYGSKHGFRLAVMDKEILDRFEAYIGALGIPYRRRRSHTGTADEGIFVEGKHRTAVMEKTLDEWRETEQFYRGFLAGIFDAEGSYDGQLLRIANGDETILGRIRHCLDALNIEHIRQDRGEYVPFITISNTPNAIRFVAATQPACARKTERVFEHNLYGQAVVQSVEPLGEETVYSVETSAETYIAEGFASHNCWLAKAGTLQKMSVDTLHDAINWLRAVAADTPSIHMFGTEPTKHWALIEEARRYAPEMEISMTTNGYLLTDERIKWLDDNNVRIYIYSIDGDKESNKERVTRAGKNSWDQVAKNLRKVMASEQRHWVTARGTWFPSDYDLVKRYRALEELGATSISFVPVTGADGWDEAKVAEAYMELCDYYDGGPSPSKFIEEMIRRVASGPQTHPGNGCGTGFHSWAISPDGRLSLCQGFQEEEIGTIGSIYDGITTEEPFEISRKVDAFHATNPYPKEACRTCPAYNYCQGVGFCGSENFFGTGQPDVPPDGYCAHLRGMVTACKHWLGRRQMRGELLLGQVAGGHKGQKGRYSREVNATMGNSVQQQGDGTYGDAKAFDV